MLTKSFGELRPETISGRLLRLLAGLPDVRTIVEVGTLDGTGSTRSILNGMRDRRDFAEVNFFSIEANKAAYDLAVANLTPIPPNLHLAYGSLLDTDSPLLILNMTEQEAIWWKNDLTSRISAPNIIDNLPAQIDLLLLDGGEFTGFNDFLKLGPRSNILVMDDVAVRKNRLSREISIYLGFIELFNDGRLSVFCHSQRSANLFRPLVEALSSLVQSDA